MINVLASNMALTATGQAQGTTAWAIAKTGVHTSQASQENGMKQETLKIIHWENTFSVLILPFSMFC
jgi:large exoprotein involved in heme utilization and adhesion